MTRLEVGTVDVHVVRPRPDGWRVLVLRRGEGTRCTGAWETVHGSIEGGELPEEAALRELHEETGLEAERLYNVCVNPFYLHRTDTVQLSIVFCAFVREGGSVVTGVEHDSHDWLTVAEACARLAWPRERQTLLEAYELLQGGDAGPVEDVLRVR